MFQVSYVSIVAFFFAVTHTDASLTMLHAVRRSGLGCTPCNGTVPCNSDPCIHPSNLGDIAKQARHDAAREFVIAQAAEAAGKAAEAVRLEELHNAKENLTTASEQSQQALSEEAVKMVTDAVLATQQTDAAIALEGQLFRSAEQAVSASADAQVHAASLEAAQEQLELLVAQADSAEAAAKALAEQAEADRQRAEESHELYMATEKAAQNATTQAEIASHSAIEQLILVAEAALGTMKGMVNTTMTESPCTSPCSAMVMSP